MRELTLDRPNNGTPPVLKASEKRKLLKQYQEAQEYLEDMKKDVEIVTDEKDIIKYVERGKRNGAIAIDTETSELDPLTAQLVGLSLYTDGEKSIYIPHAHRDMETLELIPNQASLETITKAMEIVRDTEETIFFNSVFDVRVIKSATGVKIEPTWDCYVAGRLLDENNKKNNLKDLFAKYITKNTPEKGKYGDLFGNMGFTYVPIEVGGVYAGRDPYMTYKLYEFQKSYMTGEKAKKYDLEDIYKVFREIEMPLQSIIADIEDRGVLYDPEYGKELLDTYEELLKERVELFNDITSELKPKIIEYQEAYELRKANGEDVRYQRLDYPVNYRSPSQLSILLYDIMQFSTAGRKKGEERSTAKGHLERIDHPIASALLDIAEIEKQLTTYVRKFPELARYDGRIHTQFNSVGADTLRFSSKNQNLQNISAKNTDIRKVFRASHGYSLISSDYSKQEIVIASALSNDSNMKESLASGRDVYSVIASLIYHRPYDECTEAHSEEGGKRRYNAKQIALSLLYGKQVYTLAKELGITTNEAKRLVEKFFDSFSNINNWINKTIKQAKERGYVTNLVGTKRRLPELRVPDYEFIPTRGNTITDLQRSNYTQKMKNAWSKNDREMIKAQALREFIKIVDNTYPKLKAERQAVNAPVQSSASYMMKLAMLKIARDEELNRMGYRMLIPIHDEILGEAPEEYAEEAGKRVAELMGSIAEDLNLGVAVQCDVDISKRWYENKEATYMIGEEDETVEI